MLYPEDITPQAVEDAQRLVRDFLQGADTLPMAAEQELVEVAADIRDGSISALEENPFSSPDWLRYIWGAALARDISYARAGRGRMLALGADAAMQGFYETNKITRDNPES